MTDDPLDGAASGADAPTPTRSGSHRVERAPTAVVMPILIVAVAVLAIAVGAYGWMTAFDDGDTASAVEPLSGTPTGPPPSLSPTATPTPTSEPSESSTPANSPEPSTSAKASDKPKPSDKPSDKPKPTKTAAPVARTTPVVVLNQTSISGLAASTAAQLRADGWQVTGIGNWRGAVPSTTVYYPPGKGAQATLLARDVGTQRVLPAVSGMRVDRLTVILTSASG